MKQFSLDQIKLLFLPYLELFIINLKQGVVVFLDVPEHLTQHYSDVYYTVLWNLFDVFDKMRYNNGFDQVDLISIFDYILAQEVRVCEMSKYRLHHTNECLPVSKNRAAFEALYLIYELI